MSFGSFVSDVELRAGISHEEAEQASVVIVQELCARLPGEEANDLLAQLPYGLKRGLVSSPMVRITKDEFVDRIAHRLLVSPEEARARVAAVFTTLRQSVSWGAFEDILEQLDPDYAELLA
jgi:uncharacterized protein (DUF2267 family)